MKEQIICGFDYSVNSPGVVFVKTDNEFNVVDRAWLTFTNKKKYVNDDPRNRVIYINTTKGKRTYPNSLDQATSIRDIIWEWFVSTNCFDINYVAFEDYALAANGRVFHIAEVTMTMKLQIYNCNIPMRLYPPNHIKLFATGHGNADKFEMEDAFEALTDVERCGMDLTCLPTLHEQKNGNPRDNVIDAFWVSELLRTELRIRSGNLMINSLPEHQIKVFNLLTKSFTTNILARNFLQKGVYCD